MHHRPPMKNSPRRHSGVLAATVLMLSGLALFVALAWSSHASLRAVEAGTEARGRARMGLLQAAEVLSALKDVETGQRGYMLTGDEQYLAPFTAGVDALGPAFGALRVAAAGLPALDPDSLRVVVERRVELARRNIEARRKDGPDRLNRYRFDEGRTTMDEIRARFEVIERALRGEIERRDLELSALRDRALLLNLLLPASGVVLILAAYTLLQRERRRRRRAEEALIAVNASLEDTVGARTAELRAARDQIEAFASGLDRSIEAERRRLAREVHDQLGQLLTALKMMVHRALQEGPGRDRAWPQIQGVLDEGIATVRRISAALRPPLLDDLGLEAALGLACRQFAERTGVACEVVVGDSDRLSADQANQLYRIVQEALTNVARHAGATTVRVEGTVADGVYHLAVEDDGRGMAPGAAAALGMVSMRERAALAGGGLRIGAGRRAGLRIEVCVPVCAPGEEDKA